METHEISAFLLRQWFVKMLLANTALQLMQETANYSKFRAKNCMKINNKHQNVQNKQNYSKQTLKIR